VVTAVSVVPLAVVARGKPRVKGVNEVLTLVVTVFSTLFGRRRSANSIFEHAVLAVAEKEIAPVVYALPYGSKYVK
jgi:hypothetical protein